MKAKLVARKNPQNDKAPAKYYAQPVYDGMVDIDFIAKQIAGRSSLTAGDIKNVLSNFLDELPTYMLLGYSVKLNEFGTFRISFSSEGVEDPAKFKTTLINGLKVIYTPDSHIKERLSNDITYTVSHAAAKAPEGGETEGEDDKPDSI